MMEIIRRLIKSVMGASTPIALGVIVAITILTAGAVILTFDNVVVPSEKPEVSSDAHCVILNNGEEENNKNTAEPIRFIFVTKGVRKEDKPVIASAITIEPENNIFDGRSAVEIILNYTVEIEKGRPKGKGGGSYLRIYMTPVIGDYSEEDAQWVLIVSEDTESGTTSEVSWEVELNETAEGISFIMKLYWRHEYYVNITINDIIVNSIDGEQLLRFATLYNVKSYSVWEVLTNEYSLKVLIPEESY